MVASLDQKVTPEGSSFQQIEYEGSLKPNESCVLHVQDEKQLEEQDYSTPGKIKGFRSTSGRVEIFAKGNGKDKQNKEISTKKAKETTEAKKNPANLTPEDLKAIKTVQYTCLWYLILTFSAVLFLLTAQNLGGETVAELTRNRLLFQISIILGNSNSSFNFCFYMRARSFRATFRERWF